MTNELLTLAKRVQAIAESGLHYTESDWDIDRYKDLEKIVMGDDLKDYESAH